MIDAPGEIDENLLSELWLSVIKKE
jgi:hypothetical protein